MRRLLTTKRGRHFSLGALSAALRATLALLLTTGLPAVTAAATITIVNLDGPNEGFNDPTPATPVGGNPGTTVGQQRLNVFAHAASIWGGILPSNVEIRIQANFDALTCTSTSAVLGSAGAIVVFRNFTGAPFANTWYHGALANKIANSDLDPTNNDIRARFNSALNGNPACLGGTGWYYGFDGNEGANIELLPVVLHEMAHGLGFSTFSNASTGALLNGFPDIYTRFMLDTDVGLTWDQMSDFQRQQSAVNSGGLVWNGPAVTTMVPLLLGGTPRLQVNAPGAIAGSYPVGTASFGAPLDETGVTGDLVLADDGSGTSSDGCEAIQNDVSGKIALIDRGSCTFVSKALNAQNAGAIGVIIADNVVSATPPGLGGTDPSITIPVVSVTNADGNLLKSQLGSGVNVTIGLDLNQRSGANAQNQVLLYAPNPVESGSSISHFDTSALPNLLMEPAISASLSSDVDLTRYHFEDIGWLPQTTDVAENYAVRLQLRGAAPNPFAASTAVRFELFRQEFVQLSIYDVAGRLVRHVTRRTMEPGSYAVLWDGRDESGRNVAPGVYFSVLRSGGVEETQRIVRVR
jgi:hypothetical protein